MELVAQEGLWQIHSGEIHILSGSVAIVSGGVFVSGTVTVQSGRIQSEQRVQTLVRFTATSGKNPMVTTAASGGVTLESGDTTYVTLRFVPEAQYSGTYILVSSSVAGVLPFHTSGFLQSGDSRGFVLAWGDGITIPTDNFNDIAIVATLSGARVSYIGSQY